MSFFQDIVTESHCRLLFVTYAFVHDLVTNRRGKTMKQHNKILLGFVLGVTLGLIGYYSFPLEESASYYGTMKFVSEILTFVGAMFLRLIFMVVVPLILSALMLGTLELSQGVGLGKVGGRSLLYTVLLSVIAACIAVGITGIFKPGKMLAGTVDAATLAANKGVMVIQANVTKTVDKAWYQYIVDLFPANPISAAVNAFSGEIIAMMVFALFFGWALSTVIKEDHPLPQVLEAIFQACMKVIAVAMSFAHYAIFGIVFNTAYKMGAGFLGNVALFALVVVAGLLIQLLVTYPIFLKVLVNVNAFKLYSKMRHVMLYAFTTASSNATLPINMECAKDVLKLPPQIVRFVLTVGASANQNGSGLYEGVTVLFLAQVFGIDLSVGQMFTVILMSTLAGVGTAGIPGGSLPLIVVLMVQVGVPAEGIGLILGVDRFLDMCRTTLNVTGDTVIAALVTGSVDDKALDSLRE